MNPAAPMVMSTPRMGAMRPPAKPTRPSPTAMVVMNTFSEFTPSSAATSGWKATVRMPRPMRVRLRKKCSASRMAMLMRITATRSMPMTTPQTFQWPLNTGGMPRGLVPNTCSTN